MIAEGSSVVDGQWVDPTTESLPSAVVTFIQQQ